MSASDLVVAAVLVQQGDDGFDMSLFDDVQGFRTLHQHTVQHLQDPCSAKFTLFILALPWTQLKA